MGGRKVKDAVRCATFFFFFFVNERREGGLLCPGQALISPAGAGVPPDALDHDLGRQTHGRVDH